MVSKQDADDRATRDLLARTGVGEAISFFVAAHRPLRAVAASWLALGTPLLDFLPGFSRVLAALDDGRTLDRLFTSVELDARRPGGHRSRR